MTEQEKERTIVDRAVIMCLIQDGTFKVKRSDLEKMKRILSSHVVRFPTYPVYDESGIQTDVAWITFEGVEKETLKSLKNKVEMGSPGTPLPDGWLTDDNILGPKWKKAEFLIKEIK